MNYVTTLCLTLTLLLTSCVCSKRQPTSIDFRSTTDRVHTAGDTNLRARKLISEAQSEARRARAEAVAARSLVERMESEASPYAVQVEKLRGSYEGRIAELQKHIQETDKLLAEQWQELELAKHNFQAAQEALVVSEEKVAHLEKKNAQLREDSDKWEDKYRSLTKYRWLVFSGVALFALGVIAKFRGILF